MKTAMQAAFLLTIATGAQADEPQRGAQITIELNTFSQVDTGWLQPLAATERTVASSHTSHLVSIWPRYTAARQL